MSPLCLQRHTANVQPANAPLENNARLTLMYWHICECINREVLGNERAEYGKRIVSAVSTQLQRHLHKGRKAACQRWEYSTED